MKRLRPPARPTRGGGSLVALRRRPVLSSEGAGVHAGRPLLSSWDGWAGPAGSSQRLKLVRSGEPLFPRYERGRVRGTRTRSPPYRDYERAPSSPTGGEGACFSAFSADARTSRPGSPRRAAAAGTCRATGIAPADPTTAPRCAPFIECPRSTGDSAWASARLSARPSARAAAVR